MNDSHYIKKDIKCRRKGGSTKKARLIKESKTDKDGSGSRKAELQALGTTACGRYRRGYLLGRLQYRTGRYDTQEFCISAHEMRDNAYEGIQESVHYKNTSGVQATCPDCHVPRGRGSTRLQRKVYASRELVHKALGTISTPEKYEANRLAMAERVWESMRATDSR